MNGPTTFNPYIPGKTPENERTTNTTHTRSGRIKAKKVKTGSRIAAATLETTRPATVFTPGAAAVRQSAQLPAFAPLLEELEVAGWSSHRRLLSGNFHDWSLLDNRTLLVMAGQAVVTATCETFDPIESALLAQGAWASIRSHAQHAADAGTLLSLAARSLWCNVSSELQVAMAIALLELEGGHASVAVAGDCPAIRIRAAGCDPVASRQPMLGAVADFSYLSHSVELSLRERIVLIADDPRQRPAKLMARIAASFARLDAETHRRMLASDAISVVRQEFEPLSANSARPAASIVAVRRR